MPFSRQTGVAITNTRVNGKGAVLLRSIASDIRKLKGMVPKPAKSISVETMSLTITKMGPAMMAVRCPLCTDPHGTIRVRGIRVTPDTIVTAFRAGGTAEEIALKFPTVTLADVYKIIAHYSNHTTEIDALSTCLSAKPPPQP
jgi:uncharacterized protein (DUF433 family)